MLHSDKQYAVILGRHLTVALGGDCTPHKPSYLQPSMRTCGDYQFEFDLLAREILLAESQTFLSIDAFSGRLLSFLDSMPHSVRFSTQWLNMNQAAPPFPVDIQAAMLHMEAHHFLVAVGRQIAPNKFANQGMASCGYTASTIDEHEARGTECIRYSCREVLRVFEYFNKRQRRAWTKWTVCQQSYDAAVVLGTSNIILCDTSDDLLLSQTYQSFVEIHRLGIHRLADSAARKLASFVDWTWMHTSSASFESCASSSSLADISALSRNEGKLSLGQDSELLQSLAHPNTKGSATKGRQGTLSSRKTKHNKTRASTSKDDPFANKDMEDIQLQASDRNNWGNGNNQRPTQVDVYETSYAKFDRAAKLLPPLAPGLTFPEATKIQDPERAYGSAAAGRYCTAEGLIADQAPQSISAADLPRFFHPAGASMQALLSAHTSQVPSLIGSSYPSSVYTNSVPSCFNTPPVSHPVSPLLGSGSLGFAGETQSALCNGQPITQPQTPTWSFSNSSGSEGPDASDTTTDAFGRQVSTKWVWPNC